MCVREREQCDTLLHNDVRSPIIIVVKLFIEYLKSVHILICLAIIRRLKAVVSIPQLCVCI